MTRREWAELLAWGIVLGGFGAMFLIVHTTR